MLLQGKFTRKQHNTHRSRFAPFQAYFQKIKLKSAYYLAIICLRQDFEYQFTPYLYSSCLPHRSKGIVATTSAKQLRIHNYPKQNEE
ncbi:hypothetical protein DC20_03440 [Rufibacter tibetensis]|uniref:Uncharacterized protein n=1 Tax=Rufibacter tibetensis TaxID=512763 RepID=A0A0P0C078_9BACT|nr:hypothetical protein DC20_03440 [Rufibacter tibetensis]